MRKITKLECIFDRLELGKANVGLGETGGAVWDSGQVGNQRATDTPRLAWVVLTTFQ